MEDQSVKDINNKINIPIKNDNFFIRNKIILILWIFGFLGFVLHNITQLGSDPQHRNAQMYPFYIFFALLLFFILKLFDKIKITRLNKIYKLFISKLIILIISFIISYYLALILALIVWILSFGGNFRYGG
jgi:hypothetical protein